MWPWDSVPVSKRREGELRSCIAQEQLNKRVVGQEERLKA